MPLYGPFSLGQILWHLLKLTTSIYSGTETCCCHCAWGFQSPSCATKQSPAASQRRPGLISRTVCHACFNEWNGPHSNAFHRYAQNKNTENTCYPNIHHGCWTTTDTLYEVIKKNHTCILDVTAGALPSFTPHIQTFLTKKVWIVFNRPYILSCAAGRANKCN